jgi:hypothetical protein
MVPMRQCSAWNRRPMRATVSSSIIAHSEHHELRELVHVT